MYELVFVLFGIALGILIHALFLRWESRHIPPHWRTLNRRSGDRIRLP